MQCAVAPGPTPAPAGPGRCRLRACAGGSQPRGVARSTQRPAPARPRASRRRARIQCPHTADCLPMSDEQPTSNESAQALRQAALDYHRLEPRGKIKVVATKPMLTQRDLALAYSPGVAYACEEIAADPAKASDYTARGNLV